jgi:superfamily II DNA or RNA helicase
LSDSHSNDDKRRTLAEKIFQEEQLISEIHAALEHRRALVSSFKEQLAAIEPHADRPTTLDEGAPSTTATLSSEEKVRMFRSLFRGREDVFARRWESRKTGKAGYSPACANEWDPVLCGKARGPGNSGKTNCLECCQHAFFRVTDDEIEKHLKGLQVIGVYPLLADETSWFLAADFDDGAWQEDVASFRETCRSHDVPVAIERSRSGKGAHAWLFFSEPVSCSLARNLGCFLITETMVRRHQLSMSSYDRLFPSQDTLPKGGFGNLIALPLQREARAKGNSVFVDASFSPYADQWTFLSNIQRIDSNRVREIVQDAGRRGKVMGLRMVDTEEEPDQTPWKRPPSGYSERVSMNETLPREVHAVISQRLFLERNGLPSPLLNQIKRLAAFQNPEFYKRQGMRLSTALTPRVIACAEELSEHIALPRGCRPEVEALLNEYGIAFSVADKREKGAALDCCFTGTLTSSQERAAKALLAHDIGVLVAPPGTGKTVVGIFLIAMRRRNTLVLVHRKPLLDQWVAQIALFLDKEPKEIGQIGSGKNRPTGMVDVAMIQSLIRLGRVADLVAGYGHVIVDECHHVPAVSFERVLSEVKARFVTGLTATPRRRDGQQPILHMQLGPTRFAVDSRNKNVQRPFVQSLIVRETEFTIKQHAEQTTIQALYSMLATDRARNNLICKDVIQALKDGRSPIVLTERREHLERLAEELRANVPDLVVLHGTMKTSTRREALAHFATAPDGKARLLLATGRYIGEGFDDARLDSLFLALPVSWKGTLIQYSGRLHRPYARKTEVRIYDYVDRKVPILLRMFEKRLRGYRAMGYVRVKDNNETREELEESTSKVE